MVVYSVASHVLLYHLGHLILVVLESLRDQTPSMPFFEVFLNSKSSNVASMHPLFHLFHTHPMPEHTLDRNCSFLFLDNLRFDFQAHQQVLLSQVLNLPLRDGDAKLIGVKLG